MPRRALLAALAAAVLLAAGCSEAGLGDERAQTDTGVVGPGGRTVDATAGERAPDFSVPALRGDGEYVLAYYRGRPVVLNFWASWCEPCKREMPDLVAFATAHPAVAVLGLAVNDKPSDSRRFADRFEVPYDLGIDQKARVAGRYGVTGLPVTVLLDREGRIVSTRFGAISRDELESFAERFGA